MITKEECLTEIKRLHDLYGKVTKQTFMEHGQLSYDTVKRRCGSISKAFAELGIELSQGQRKFTSKEEIITDLQHVHQKLGRLSKPLYEQYGKFTPKVIQRAFGSWSAMMNELGFEIAPNGYIPTDDELIQDLLRLQEEHGMVTADIIRKFGKFSTTTYHERFNSINDAYMAAGLETREAGQCSHATWVINRFAKTIGEEPLFEHRFDWLRNPKTNRHLPVDGYFQQAGIVIEYNGPQHYHVDDRYMPTEEALAYRQHLDQLKYDLIRKNGLKLIVIDYRDSFTQEYIHQQLA